jgi:hypothetical protein
MRTILFLLLAFFSIGCDRRLSEQVAFEDWWKSLSIDEQMYILSLEPARDDSSKYYALNVPEEMPYGDDGRTREFANWLSILRPGQLERYQMYQLENQMHRTDTDEQTIKEFGLAKDVLRVDVKYKSANGLKFNVVP